MVLEDIDGPEYMVPVLDDDALRAKLVLLTERMELEATEHKDIEMEHVRADALLVETVRALAQYCDRVDAAEKLLRYYGDVCKWYA